jgi:hypothetical protein
MTVITDIDSSFVTGLSPVTARFLGGILGKVIASPAFRNTIAGGSALAYMTAMAPQW